jgi:alpha-amylase/alpha-mannosidase (GH57 family)
LFCAFYAFLWLNSFSSAMPFLIIHGHFYQPPRENPWTGIVEEQPGAAPFHDWNERIHFECYRPNAFVRIGEPETADEHFINNYALVSFDVGPTLLTWLERHHPYTYARIIEADRETVLSHAGHGNAIAQAYGHAILPLCNERDLRTQIRWGLADFLYRFGREAEAMWLPETACNDRVMDALIDEGLRFVILAPRQAARVREPGTTGGSDQVNLSPDESAWHDVNETTIDTSIAYRHLHRDGSARSIAVFFYDGSTSRAIAFENLLRSSQDLLNALERSANDQQMINVATDGETYGHHFKFGDLCLAHALAEEAPARGLQITNYGEYLAQHPAEFEVEINNGPDGEGTSWSCPHGVGRWIRDCGCHTGGKPGWNQAWRGPLRAALDYLREENVAHFEGTRGNLFIDPWQARDHSIALILDRQESRETFLFEHAGRWLSADEQGRALTYLELQRMLLLMYTSCGSFFNDISGIETIQVLKYAARAIDLMRQLKLPSVCDRFLEILSEAKSNRPELGTGADVYRRLVEPTKPNFQTNAQTAEPLMTEPRNEPAEQATEFSPG